MDRSPRKSQKNNFTHSSLFYKDSGVHQWHLLIQVDFFTCRGPRHGAKILRTTDLYRYNGLQFLTGAL
jgi:hypothetical protein